LVCRGDERGATALKRELEGDPAFTALDAAERLADRALLPALLALRDRGWAEDAIDQLYLDGAITACGGD
jgi:hypothetical protein